jgi:hypothetical protein
MGSAQTQSITGLIHEHQGAHFGAHEPGGLAYDAWQDLIQVEAGTDVLPNIDEGGQLRLLLCERPRLYLLVQGMRRQVDEELQERPPRLRRLYAATQRQHTKYISSHE